MKNEITLQNINGHKVLKTRLRVPPPKVEKDKTKYNRTLKHKGNREW